MAQLSDVQRERSIPSVAVGHHVVTGWAWGTVAVALATLLVSVLAGRALGLAHLRYALALPAGVLLGPAGAAGFAFGGLCQSLLRGGPLLATGATAAGDLILVVFGYAVWDWQSPAGPTAAPVRTLGTYVAAAIVGTVGGVAVAAVGLELLGRATVVSLVPPLVTDRLLALLVAGPVVIVDVAVLTGGDPRRGRRGGPETWTVLGVLFVSLTWLVGTYAASLVHRDVAAFPSTRASVLGALPGPLEEVGAVVFGDLYSPLLAISAVLAAGAVLALFAQSDYALMTRRGDGASR